MSPAARRVPELLAPAGGPQSFRAAISNGADAVYLGVDRLNARRGAENFNLETLRAACEFAHLRGRRVYLTANVVVLPDEYADALRLIDAAWAAGVDAVIVQDLGLLRGIATALPWVRVHASTQLNTHSSSTAVALAGSGVSRVTLSRETSLAEIGRITLAAHEAGVETESFVHGALCVCYSGQCLFSSLIGGRSANRGMCAQPCRLTYELVDELGTVLATPGAHLLSPKDLAGIGVLPQLVASGVDSLKIEGRMKSAEYVAIVTGVYRAALDRAAVSPESYEVRDGELAVLSEAFSRGFTEAYLEDERGNDMMSYQRPNNRGLLVGRITSIRAGSASIAIEAALSSQDTIEVWTGRGRFAQAAGTFNVNGELRDHVGPGETAGLVLEQPAGAGDRVFRVRNAALVQAAERTYSGTDVAQVPVSVSVKVVSGAPLAVTLSTAEGVSATATGSVVEPARTRAVSASEIMEHVGRFGGSTFTALDWDLDLSAGVGIGFSELHRTRREAVSALEKALLEPWAARRLSDPQVPALPTSAIRAGAVDVVAVVGSEKAARACLEAGASRVHLVSGRVPEDISPVTALVLPRIAHDLEEAAALSGINEGSLVVAGTLGQLSLAAGRGAAVEAHWSLNAVNAHSVAALAERGAGFVWLSPELSARQISDVVRDASVPVGMAVSGRQEVMVTEHCVLMAEGECDRACAGCARRRVGHVLRDRKGYEFPVATDAAGRTHIYNSVPLDLTAALPEVLATGVSAVRIDLEAEKDPRAAAAEVRRVLAALRSAEQAVAPQARERSGVTGGHFFRGVS